MRKTAYAIVAASLVAGAIALFVPPAGAVASAPALTRQPLQGFTQDFGSKHVVGYFARTSDSCAVRLVLTQRQGEDYVQMTGTTIDMAVDAGKSVVLGSGEGPGLHLQCSDSANNLAVTLTASGA